MQQFGAQLSDRGLLLNFNVAEAAETFANRAGDAKFPRR
jgi:hypothetical protein